MDFTILVFRNSIIYSLISLGYFFIYIGISSADAPRWDFSVPHIGRVLDEGGWYQEYSLGSVNGSPEFNFPLQLVYLSTRANSGMFGAQWFCPQLESTVIPQGAGGFIWQATASRSSPTSTMPTAGPS